MLRFRTASTARTVCFSGRTDPGTHPVPARRGGLVVELQRVRGESS